MSLKGDHLLDTEPPTPTLRLLEQLFSQGSELAGCEIKLIRAELAQSTATLASGAIELFAGGAMIFAGILAFLGAVAFFLVRFGVAQDLAFLIVAVVCFAGGGLAIMMGVKASQPKRLMPTRTIRQLSLLFGGR